MSVHAEPPPPLVREPRRFEYETAEQLGKGGFAICHRATLLDQGNPTGRVVALKIVRSKMEPPKLAQKFVTELQIHSKLHHPNIVDFYRAFSFQDSTYVVLEICENGSLADILKKRRCFTMPEIRRFVIQTCGAVKYLHHRNIIHRDLKTGNLFLDKDMNVKVGDFGLAAVLVSQNDLGARRTTMCGTPNYLAPEILEKGGRGHNEKVDLWAIGIIAYTLAVGKAPFHAPKREDIYKKLQTRDYQWPEVGKTSNNISQDLKDLVGSLLVHEDDRPNPDLIVSHDFFRLGYTPSRLDVRYKLGAPKWNIKPLSPEAQARGYTDEWFRICKESGVGELPDGRVFSIIGGRKIRSVVKDCEKELALGKQPVVPIPSDIVYVPYPEREDWPFPTSNGGLSEIVEEKEPSQDALAEITANDRAQSAISKPPKRATSRQHKENFAPQPLQTGENLARPKRTRTMQTAIRTVSSSRPSRPSREVKSAPEMACIDEKPASRTPPSSPDDSEEAVRPSHRDVAKATKKQPERVDSMDLPQARPFVPDPDMVPHSDPSTVLARAATFRDNIARALANKPNPVRKPASSYYLPFVCKWVDYSRKHGVGYVLEDNSIGCLLNATARDPVTHVVVRNGYEELKLLHSQVTSIDKLPLEFYVDCGHDGIRKTEVSRDRKRTTGILWSKFARYMCNQLRQPSQEDSSEDNSNKKPTTFVRFYQRFGSVGIWGFEDGAFQFNFPDHTKLVLSADGCYCNFTCLSVEAAEHLAACGELPFKYIKQRNLLSSSVRTLLHSTGEKGVIVRQIAKANHLKEKLHFITTVVDAWIAGGGLGCASSDTEQLRWKGPQLEDGKKQEWVTVGRYGGDAARTA